MASNLTDRNVFALERIPVAARVGGRSGEAQTAALTAKGGIEVGAREGRALTAQQAKRVIRLKQRLPQIIHARKTKVAARDRVVHTANCVRNDALLASGDDRVELIAGK